MLAGVYSRDLTACGIPRGLDALTACRMGVMSWLDATPKPPKVKGGTPSCATRDRLLAGDLGSTVCGASPPQKPASGDAYLLAGAANFLRLPPAFFGSLGVNAQKVGSATQINNFVEIEFTRLSPLR
ncbi:hypothetical protein DSJ_23310 (plasmid) [Pantoea stewartii subsp. stewartii DC283]|uniref:Uncharacterized protein n=1 Tax=Pantoea stewartii subsp. stewartii DC283 TaxID=660596 RepID=A0ABN4ZED1_PANSE|nr:hypothetical protein DSJ_23310 [Pantoea stewartii subsp. stewartii DC283]